jgi:hypothetical protein
MIHRSVYGVLALAAASFPSHRALAAPTASLASDDRAFVSPGVGADDLVGIVGNYDVAGVHPEGTQYTGTGTVTRLSAQVYQMAWTTAQGTFYGLVLRRRDLLLGGWGYKQDQRAAVYHVEGKTLDGVTIVSSRAGLGREVLTGGELDQTGSFTISSGLDVEGTSYGGTVLCTLVTKEVRRLEWRIDGHVRRGYGVREGSDFIVGYDESGGAGPVRYQITAGGSTLVGVFLDPQLPHLGLGSETMTRVD